VTGREHEQEPRAITHRAWCYFLNRRPEDGDEAATCNCGAYEDAYAAHCAAESSPPRTEKEPRREHG
jgi:hypothetical protein